VLRLAGKYFQLAAFVMLVYDHSKYLFLAVQATLLTSALPVLTFSQEVGWLYCQISIIEKKTYTFAGEEDMASAVFLRHSPLPHQSLWHSYAVHHSLNW